MRPGTSWCPEVGLGIPNYVYLGVHQVDVVRADRVRKSVHQSTRAHIIEAEESWLYGRVNEGEGEFRPRVPTIKFSVRNCGRPGSKSNTGAEAIQIKRASQTLV